MIRPFRPIIAKGRANSCRACPKPCPAYLAGTLNHFDPEAACPLSPPRWRPWSALCATKRPLGLGDAVALIAQPIARAIDATLGTNLKQCPGCASRRARLNAAVPSIMPTPRGDRKV